MRKAGTIAILVVTAIVIPVYLWLGLLSFIPRLDYGTSFSLMDGKIHRVNRNGPAAMAGIVDGDRFLDLPRGDALAGFRLEYPQAGDQARIATRHGIRTLRAAPFRRSTIDAASTLAALLSAVIVIAFATLLCVRRPGMMSLAFWLYAVTSIAASNLIPLFTGLPAALAVALWLPVFGLVGGAFAFPLIPFALRFPSGKLAPGSRWAEAAAWIAFWFVIAAQGAFGWQLFAGNTDQWNSVWFGYGMGFAPLPIAAAILAWRYARSSTVVRAQTAWALAGFGISILAQIVYNANVAFVYAFTLHGDDLRIVNNLIIVLANLSPLLAIYPILRHRLFDLGFVVNRATLYSVLTLAAVGTLAGVNWIAQHFITERLAALLQPVAAIVIGLGYLRVRSWTQALLERTIFRDRLAAEVELEGTIKGFAHAERPEALDESLTAEATSILSLRSAAVFRLRGDVLARAASVGWDEATLEVLARDDRLVRRLLADEASTTLDALRWTPDGLPPPPNEPVVAFVLRSGSALAGVAFYGRHVNGTEIDPQEMQLLRRLCDAAASIYRTTELQTELAALRSRIAVLEASPAL
jgi:hypothetical protein